ncbi:vertebrate ancient opsin-like [Bradysia coprophila]|uniref:vertebrate ancient opsin-like n=1 Tax=Bradysia coprophila TaxID=38358 RepID=UPI00187DDA5B|nr:vertebrate ancient opsin-like [Bradysia coprophila]
MSNHTSELMEPWGYDVAAAVLTVVQCFGLSLNLFVIILMCRDAQIWNPINIIIFNLAFCDFAVSIFGNPFALISAFSHRWIFGELGCKLYGFFMALLGITSITTIAVMSFERFFLVNFPFSSKQLTNRGARYSVFLIWIYSGAVTIPPLFGWGAYVSEAANISCSINWEEQSWNAKSYITFLFVFGLVVPFFVIVYCYTKILLAMRKSANRLNRTNPAEKKVIQMVFIMFSFFMIGWSPYAAFALIKQYGNKDWISPAMGVIPSIFAKVTICYNPIIYVGLNTQFRQSFFRTVGGKFSASKTTTVSTTANLMDSEAKVMVKNKLRIANVNEELRRAVDVTANVSSAEAIEMNVIGEGKRKEKSVRIEIAENVV